MSSALRLDLSAGVSMNEAIASTMVIAISPKAGDEAEDHVQALRQASLSQTLYQA